MSIGNFLRKSLDTLSVRKCINTGGLLVRIYFNAFLYLPPLVDMDSVEGYLIYADFDGRIIRSKFHAPLSKEVGCYAAMVASSGSLPAELFAYVTSCRFSNGNRWDNPHVDADESRLVAKIKKDT